jgi:hypothetical protein
MQSIKRGRKRIMPRYANKVLGLKLSPGGDKISATCIV